MKNDTNVYFGNGAIQRLSGIIVKEKPKKILLVRGNSSFKLFQPLLNKIIGNSYLDFQVQESTISLESSLKGVDYYIRNECDLIIAIGGGSVIDMAKLISIFSSQKQRSEDLLDTKFKLSPRLNNFVTISTTSGSGSESTHFAVVYKNTKKYSISHSSLIPDYAIIDPELTYTLSPYQTAVSGLDAFCQSIESFWSKKATDESRLYSQKAIRLILNNIESSVLDPNISNRYAMSKGAHYAGKAINISQTTAAHAFSYPLTKLHGIPHGYAVALSLSKFYRINCQDNNQSVFMNKLNSLLETNTCLEAEARINSIITNIGFNTKLPEDIIYENEVEGIINNVNLDRLNNNPVKITIDDLKIIFRSLCQ